MTPTLYTPIALAGISHHGADIARLEQYFITDEAGFLDRARQRFRGVLLLQTCNRIEVLVEGSGVELEAFLMDEGIQGLRILTGVDALRHLLEVAAGIDSLIIGEDQILGQLKNALAAAQDSGVASPVIDLCITKAIHTGIAVRKRTSINRGAVSIGSAAVELAEDLLFNLEGRHILIVGSGEIGRLVTRALASKELTAIYVANRTYDRAVALAGEVGGVAVRFDELSHYLPLADVVITCTAAPHPIIHTDMIQKVVQERRWPLDEQPSPLIIIDIAQPRDVEDAVGGIEGVCLYTIDDLRDVSERNHDIRRGEVVEARVIIEEELVQFVTLMNRSSGNVTLAALHSWAEDIRIRERDRALSRIRGADERTCMVVDDLSRVLAKRLLADATSAVRTLAEHGDLEGAEQFVRAITRGEYSCIPRED